MNDDGHDWTHIGDELRSLLGHRDDPLTPRQQAMMDDVLDVVAAWKRGELPNLADADAMAFDGWVRHEVIKRLIGDPRLADLLDFMEAIDEDKARRAGNPIFHYANGWIDYDTIKEHGGVASFDERGRIRAVTFPADVENGIAVWPPEYRQRRDLQPKPGRGGDDRKPRTTSAYVDDWFEPPTTP